MNDNENNLNYVQENILMINEQIRNSLIEQAPNFFTRVDPEGNNFLQHSIKKCLLGEHSIQGLRFLLNNFDLKSRNKNGDTIVGLLLRDPYRRQCDYLISVMKELISCEGDIDFLESPYPDENILNTMMEIYCWEIHRYCSCKNICDECRQEYLDTENIIIFLLNRHVPQLKLEDMIVSTYEEMKEYHPEEGMFYPAEKVTEILNNFNRVNDPNYSEIKLK
jgi:hypothetical protein